MSIGTGDRSLLKWPTVVAHIEVNNTIIGPLGEDERPYQNERIMAAQVGIELCVYVVGVDRGEEIDKVRVGSILSGVVDSRRIVVPRLISPEWEWAWSDN